MSSPLILLSIVTRRRTGYLAVDTFTDRTLAVDIKVTLLTESLPRERQIRSSQPGDRHEW
jgi:hypothetical protein